MYTCAHARALTHTHRVGWLVVSWYLSSHTPFKYLLQLCIHFSLISSFCILQRQSADNNVVQWDDVWDFCLTSSPRRPSPRPRLDDDRLSPQRLNHIGYISSHMGCKPHSHLMTTADQVILLGGSFPGNTRSKYEKHSHVVYMQADVLHMFVLWSSIFNTHVCACVSVFACVIVWRWCIHRFVWFGARCMSVCGICV